MGFIIVLFFMAFQHCNSNNIYSEKLMELQKRSLQSIMMLLIILLSINWISPTKAEERNFSLIDAKRTYCYLTVMNGTLYGYRYNITLKNTGDFASYVGIYIFPDFAENGIEGGTNSQYPWNASEVRSVEMTITWWNQTMVPPNKWIKLAVKAGTNQTTSEQSFLIYFHTILDVSASPSELEYPQQVTINGKLMNETSGIGIPNQDLRLYINASYKADVQTDSDGNFTYNWRPNYGTHYIYIIWTNGEGAVGSTNVTVRAHTKLSISLSSSTTYIGFKVNINGKLTYLNNSGVSGVPILLSYSVTSEQSWNDITSVNTSTNGSYSAQWIPPATGVFIARASWPGRWNEKGWILGANATVSLAVAPFEEQYVFSVLSNSTVTALAFNSTSRVLSFIASGPSGAAGYVNVTVAKPLVSDIAKLKVYVNETETTYLVTSTSDSWLLHFTYNHSVHSIRISLGPSGEPSTTSLIGIETILAITVATIMLVAFGAVYFLKLRKRIHHIPLSSNIRSKKSALPCSIQLF